MLQHLPNLRNLDLSHSKNLIKMPHFGEFPNLERLDLEGCIKLMELDPSIGLLTKLVYLNLKDCKSIISLLSNNPRPLIIRASQSSSTTSSSLKRNMLPNHSSFPTPTTRKNLFSSLHSLRELNLSFCNLLQIPNAIGCLYWLEALNLGGNNFVTVPSLRELSKLVYLSLEHCKLLKSLPVLPFPTAVEHDLCKNNVPAIETSWSIGLFIFNCPKLGETERWSSMTFSWMMQFIQANPQFSHDSSDRIQIVTPGSEMPSWFNNQSKGNLIRIDSSPIMHDNNNNIVGCVCCVVFSMTPRDHPTMRRSSPSRHAYLGLEFTDTHGRVIGKTNTNIQVTLNERLITVKSNHIWLTYFPLDLSSDLLNRTLWVDTSRYENDLKIEVKNCGYRWVYKQDLQEFNLTKMNHRNSLGGKLKSLAIEDEAQQ